MTVQWDLWNEPDSSNFWGASQSQYLQMWSRFYAKVRAAFPNQLIVGPSTASQPNTSNTWWTTYLSYVKANNVAPDIYSWHDEPGDPVTDVGRANSTLTAAGLTNSRPYQINEYATPHCPCSPRVAEPGSSAAWNGPAPTDCAATGAGVPARTRRP
ncbi:hypothetical protein [Streptomyces mirabilis]|uniref:hypothetical protein n=1 Tax=Streptomyces mirabilis TaxID=68239 RepID=UPI0036C71F62